MSKSPSRFRDNSDGTYSILLPDLADLADPSLDDNRASGVKWLSGSANDYKWQSNVVVRGIHTLEVRRLRPSDRLYSCGQTLNPKP
jgi:hypothetical protein